METALPQQQHLFVVVLVLFIFLTFQCGCFIHYNKKVTGPFALDKSE